MSPKTMRSLLGDIARVVYLLQQRYDIVPTFNKISGVGKGLKSRKSDKRKKL